MNDPETRQFQNPILCFHDPSLPIQIRETLLYSITIQTVIPAETTPAPPLSLSQTTETTPLPSLSLSQEQHVHLVGGKRVLWEQRGIPCRGGTKSAMIFLSFVENFLKVESENEHQQLSWHYLTHWNWVGERCLLVWMSRFLKKCQGSTLFDQYSITWCQVLLDRFDWFWHVWNLDLEPHWSQGWLCHVSNQFVLCELTFISITCSWSTVNYISFPPQEQIPKVGEWGLGWAWRAVRPSQLWCVQVKKKSPTKILHMCVDQNSMETETLFHKHRKSWGSGSRKAVTRMVRD